jgi:hypothetical protein
MLVLGWRGRRTNDHPLCRRCGFDLFGRPADSTHCAECGADLLRRRAVRVGARRRPGRVITAALLLLVPSAAYLGSLAWSAATEVPFVRREPLWWLLNDAAAPDATTRDAAFAELFFRLRAGELSDAQTTTVADRALAIQADPKKTWLPEWGDFIEEAYRARKLRAEQWRTYAKQAPGFELVATERFRRGERAWLELVERPTRVGPKGQFVLRVHRRLTVTDAAGRSVERDFGWVCYSVGGSSALRGGWSLPLNDGVIGRLADGRQRAKLELVVEICDPARRTPVATMPLTLSAGWTVDPAAAPERGVAMRR